MSPDEEAIVTASDICDYVYDPQRWWKMQMGERYLTSAEQKALNQGCAFHSALKNHVQSTGRLPWKQPRRLTRIEQLMCIITFALMISFFGWLFWIIWSSPH